MFQPRQPGEKESRKIVGEVQSAFGYLRRQVWTHPARGAVAAVKAAFTLLGTAQPGITAGITNPDFPRTLTITGTKAGGSLTGNVKIYGTDIRGNAVTDTIALSDNATVEGVVAFKTITKIDFPARVTAADTVSIGTGTKLGLDRAMSYDEVMHGNVDTTRDATRPVGTPSKTDISLNLVAFTTALANTKVFSATYIATEKTQSANTTA